MRGTTALVTVAAVGTGLAGAAVVAVSAACTRRVLLPFLGALVAMGALTMASLILLGGIGLDSFGGLHLLYLVATVSVPLVGVALLAVALSRRHGPLVAAGVALLLPAPVGAYASHIEPHWLRTDRFSVELPSPRAGDDPIRIAVLADLQTNHVGAHEREAVDRVLEAEPDVILLPGDLFQGRDDELDAELPALRSLLGRLSAPGGVYFVRGDTDPGDRADRILAGTHVQVLDDNIIDVIVGDRALRIGGNRLDYLSPAAVAMQRRLASPSDEETVRVLLSHRPDAVELLPADSRVDLVVAGHTHGGQIVVPGYGPPLTLSDVPRQVARGGLHEVNGNRIVVSPGVGLERGQAPQVRFLNRPAVVIVDLAEPRRG